MEHLQRLMTLDLGLALPCLVRLWCVGATICLAVPGHSVLGLPGHSVLGLHPKTE